MGADLVHFAVGADVDECEDDYGFSVGDFFSVNGANVVGYGKRPLTNAVAFKLMSF